MDLLTITKLKQTAGDTPVAASVDVQLQSCVTKTTKSGKPYLELTLADATDQFTLKIWENLPQFHSAQELPLESFLRLSGDWTQNQYGLDAQRWDFRPLNDSETADLLTGDPETSQRQQGDWDTITALCNNISDPRLHSVTQLFIQRYGLRFRRTAAARKNHHARRGGLVEHVAQMMRSAKAICSVYTDLNLDLLIAGILFHDCGKMWENTYPENGFAQPFDIQGEMLGHIPLGIDLASRLWSEIELEHETNWADLYPLTSDVRLHLLHLIASHHGTYEFGSPTLPRTPEAIALHHIDNLDAKYEMFKQAYEVAPELAPDIQQKQFPLPANLVTPLASFPKQSQGKDTNQATSERAVTKESVAPAHRPPEDTQKQQQHPIKDSETSVPDATPTLSDDEDDISHKPFDGLLF